MNTPQRNGGTGVKPVNVLHTAADSAAESTDYTETLGDQTFDSIITEMSLSFVIKKTSTLSKNSGHRNINMSSAEGVSFYFNNSL